MRKYFILIATSVISFIGCSDNDIVKRDVIESNDGDPIAFTSYTQPATKAENSTQTAVWDFFNHHTTFQVWGFKNTAEIAKPVFNGQNVTVAEATSPATGYTYTNEVIRFWDKAATKYEFYAAAPQFAENDADKWTFVAPSNATTQADGYFTTSSNLNGANLQEVTPSVTLYNSFKSAVNNKRDYDKVIASPCHWTQIGQTVELHFNHILSKLNVSILKSSDLADWTVKIKSFEVHNLYKQGTFNENLATADQSAMITRWGTTQTNRELVYTAKADVAGWTLSNVENETGDNGKYLYIIESLVIPQNAGYQVIALDGNARDAVYYTRDEYNELNGTEFANDAAYTSGTTAEQRTKVAAIAAVDATSEPYFKINYTLTSGEFTEEYTAYYNLAAAFGMDGTTNKTAIAFNEAWQNTLKVLIKPDKIEFTADIYEWANSTPDGSVEVK